MLRKILVYLVLAAFSIGAFGCAGKKSVIRGQSPESRTDVGRLRRRIRRNIEPAWEETKKGLVYGGLFALLGGLWYMDTRYNNGQVFSDMMTNSGSQSTSR